jgi:hypothetical protein
MMAEQLNQVGSTGLVAQNGSGALKFEIGMGA